MASIKTKRSTTLKTAAILGITAVLVIGGFFIFKKLDLGNSTPQDGGPKPEINYGPPTEEEKQAGDKAKEKIIEQEARQTSTQSQSGLKSVTPVITHATKSEVNAYIPGIFEENGVCTATFTQGGTTIARTSQGFGNVSTTQCAPITPNLPNNNPWSVVVSYKSATSEGSSGSVEVKQ